MLYTLIVTVMLASGAKQVALETSLTQKTCDSVKEQLSAKFSSIPEVQFECVQ